MSPRANKSGWSSIFRGLCLALSFLISATVYGQNQDASKFPARPINFIVSLPPGSVGELASRLICGEAEKMLGKPIVVVNKAGGAHAIGAATIAKAKPDGYTVGYVTPSALFTVPFLTKLNYDPIKDLQPIIQYGEIRFGIIARPDAPFHDFKQLIDYARAHPKKVTYGTGGTNSIANISIERIAREEGVQFTHIPFKAGTDYQTALLGGHVMFVAGEISIPLIEAGQIKPLLFFTEHRLAEYHQIPILKDLGYKVSYPSLLAIMEPRGVPEEIHRKLEKAFTDASKRPSVVRGMKELHLSMVHRDSDELAAYIASNYKLYGALMKETNTAR